MSAIISTNPTRRRTVPAGTNTPNLHPASSSTRDSPLNAATPTALANTVTTKAKDANNETTTTNTPTISDNHSTRDTHTTGVAKEGSYLSGASSQSPIGDNPPPCLQSAPMEYQQQHHRYTCGCRSTNVNIINPCDGLALPIASLNPSSIGLSDQFKETTVFSTFGAAIVIAFLSLVRDVLEWKDAGEALQDEFQGLLLMGTFTVSVHILTLSISSIGLGSDYQLNPYYFVLLRQTTLFAFSLLMLKAGPLVFEVQPLVFDSRVILLVVYQSSCCVCMVAIACQWVFLLLRALGVWNALRHWIGGLLLRLTGWMRCRPPKDGQKGEKGSCISGILALHPIFCVHSGQNEDSDAQNRWSIRTVIRKRSCGRQFDSNV